MANAGKALRRKMLVTTAVAAVAMAPGAAHAQLIETGPGHAVDQFGNDGTGGTPDPLTRMDMGPNQTQLTVNAEVVIAEWNQFDIASTFTLDVNDGTGGGDGATLINRVIAGGASSILGTIDAQDINFWIINQNGIIFGADTEVNANSFFASTVDVSNASLFDFYTGASDTLNFTGSIGGTITDSAAGADFNISGTPTVSMISDGTLAFVSESIDLDATFDSSNGKVAFVAASAVDVQFTPGSPLVFTNAAGSTVATGQMSVDGTVTGSSVELRMYSATGAIENLLVGATVTADSAVAGDTGIVLYAEELNAGTANIQATGALSSDTGIDIDAVGAVQLAAVDADSGDDGDGDLLIDASGDVTLTDALVGTSVAVQAGGAVLGSQDVTALDGAIDIVSSGSGNLILGALTATNGITLDTGGAITIGAVDADSDGNLTGDFNIAATPTSVTLNGAVSAAEVVMLVAGGSVTGGQDITATDGRIDIDAATINLGALSATGDQIDISGTTITTTSLTSTTNVLAIGSGNFNLGAVDAQGGNVTIATNGSITTTSIDATGTIDVDSVLVGGALNLGDLDAGAGITLDTLGTVDAGTIDAGTGALIVGGAERPSSITFGAITADDGISLFSSGAVTVGEVDADDDDDDSGAFIVGTGVEPVTQLTLNGNVKASSASIQATGNVVGGGRDFNIGTGGIDVDAAAITLGELDTDGGTVDLNGSTITTDLIDSGGAIVVTGTGNLDLGNLTSTGAIDLDTTAQVLAGSVNVGGALNVGDSVSLANSPSSVQFTGNISAASVEIYTQGSFLAESTGGTDRDITATGGSIVIDALNILAQDLETTGGSIDLTARQTMLANTDVVIDVNDLETNGTGDINIISLGDTGAGNAGGGKILTGVLDTRAGGPGSMSGDIFLDTIGNIETGNIRTGGLFVGTIIIPNEFDPGASTQAVTSVINTGGIVDLGDFTSNDIILTAGQIIADNLVSTTGNIALTAIGLDPMIADGTITANSITSAGSITLTSDDDAALDVGNLDAQTTITLSTAGPLSFGDAIANGVLDIGNPSELNIGGNINVGSFSFTTGLNFVANDVFTTSGDLNINANLIEATAVGATGGNVSLVATGVASPGMPASTILPGGVQTTSISTDGAILVQSQNGATLNLGDLQADGNITLDTDGTVTLGGVNSNPADNTLGTLIITGFSNFEAASVSFTGDARATDIGIASLGPITAQDMTATTGFLTLLSNGAISAIDLTSTDNMTLEADGSISVQAVTVTGPGSNASFRADGVTSDITTTTIENNGGVVFLSAGRNISTGDITTALAGSPTAGTAILDAGGSITSGAIDVGEDLLADAVTTFSADSVEAGDDIGIDAAGAVTIAGDVESDGQGPTTNSYSISGAPGVSTFITGADAGGNLINISGASIDIGGAIDGLDPAMNPVADVTLTTTGALVTGQIDALSLSIATPSSITFNGSVTAPTLSIATTGGIDLGGGDLTSDDVNLTADFVNAGAIIANDGSVAITATGAGADPLSGTVTTTSITAMSADTTDGNVSVTSNSGGTLDLGDVTASGNIALDTSGAVLGGTVTADSDLSGSGALQVGNLTQVNLATFTGPLTGASVTVDAANAFDANALAVTALTGAINIMAGTISAGAVSADTDASLEATGTITTASITATNGAIDVQSTGSGNLDLGDVEAGNGAALNTGGEIDAGLVDAGTGALQIGNLNQPTSATFTGPLSGGSVNINVGGVLDATGQNITASTGTLDISAGSVSAAIIGAAGANNVSATGAVTADQINSSGSTVTVNAGSISATSVSASSDATLDAAGAIDLTSVTSSGGNVAMTGASISADTVNADGNASLEASGAITTTSITSTAGNATVLGTGSAVLDLGAVTASAGAVDLQSTGGGDLTLGNVIAGSGAQLNTTGDITGSGVDAGTGALQIGNIAQPDSATFTGTLSGASVNINVLNAFDATGQNVTADNGTLDIDASDITAATISASGDATLTASGTVTANAVNSSGGSVTIGAATIAGGSVSANQDAILTASGGITTTGITASSGLIDVESTGGGALSLGDLLAGNGIEIDTSGAVGAGSTDAGAGALRVGSDPDPVASATFTGPLSGASIAITSTGALDTGGGTVTADNGNVELTADTIAAGDANASGDVIVRTQGDASFGGIGAANLDALLGGTLAVSSDVDASAAALIEAADVEFGGNVTVLGSELVLRSLAGLSVGLGDAAGDFVLDAGEIAGINTDRLVIDANDQNIGIANVTFGSNAGSSEVVIVTAGDIAITGDLFGEGDGRVFRLGGDADGTAGVLSNRITADVDFAEVNIGDSLLDLRATDIVFGRTTLIDQVEALTNVQIADQFVGNSASDLYNPIFAGALSPKLTAQPVYLRAGNLTVTYGNSALFQNSAVTAGQFSGVFLGEVGADGVLTLQPTDTTNTFAYFGQINLLIGQTVALAGGSVIVINNDTDISASRVNGCIISSGADCRTTIVGTTIIEVPREATSVLIADDGLLIPFDPLVGTNNEGLFSDAAAGPQQDCIPGQDEDCPVN